MLFCLSLPIVLYFFSLIFFLYGVKKKSQHEKVEYLSLNCSIILCVRNGENSISNILTDFENQIYKGKHEFIIVDDNSTDNTSKIVQNYVTRDNRFKYIQSKADKTNLKFKKKALNAGIAFAKYNYLLFTDVDCRVSPNWISSMISHYNEAEYIIGYSETDPSNTLVSKFQSIDFRMLMLSACSSTLLGLPLACSGQNQSYTKSLFLSVDGFKKIESLLQGDDSLFLQICRKIKKIKTKFSINPDSFVKSKTHNTWKEFIIQRMRWSGDANIMWKFNKSFFIIILSTFLTNLFIVLSLFMSIFKFEYLILFILLISIKFSLEFLLYFCGSKKMNLEISFKQFIAWFFIQIPYVILMGGLSFFSQKLSWKGRSQ